MAVFFLLGGLSLGCATALSLSEKALEKATVCAPAYDVTYEVLWKAAITAVQEIGYAPLDSYRENMFIKTDLRIEKEDVMAHTKEASMIYIFFEKAKNTIRESYILKICAPRYKSPIKEENWHYLQSDGALQQRIQAQFQKVLEQFYRQGFKG